MARAPVTFFLPDQTTPDIFADRRSLPPGESNEGNFHQWRLNYTVEGRCRMQTEKDDFVAGPGDLYLTQPRVWMTLRVCGDSQRPSIRPPTGRGGTAEEWDVAYAIFHPRPHWYAWLDALGFQSGLARMHFKDTARREIEHAIFHLVETYQKENVMRDEQTLHALENVLLKAHMRVARLSQVPDLRVRDALEFIYTQYHQPVTSARIAHAAGLSITHLGVVFTAAMGATPVQYLERIRLSRAAEMLRFSVATIGEVAAATGYPDPNYFARRFLRHYGQTPREYRNAHRVISES